MGLKITQQWHWSCDDCPETGTSTTKGIPEGWVYLADSDADTLSLVCGDCKTTLARIIADDPDLADGL